MSAQRSLQRLLEDSAARFPDRCAVVDPERATITYGELNRLSSRLGDRLRHLGVRPGDRVGLYLRKSIDAVAAIFGVLKAGAAYVPVDPEAPPQRCAYILNNCSVRVVVCDRVLAPRIRQELDCMGELPAILALEETERPLPLAATLLMEQQRDPSAFTSPTESHPDDLAYILYTSGSTGRPKGVMLTHRNALSFIDWCSQVFEPSAEDVFSSHAPLHFDLSIFDLFVSVKHGATLILIGERLGKDPLSLARVIAEKRISVWYSTPSILALLASYGKLARYDFGALRLVLFAGEVFPIPHLRALKACWATPRFFNLYGPTETNVCTYYEIPASIPESRTAPFPIGRICEPNRGRVIGTSGQPVEPGEEGELVVSGPNVMAGYWNLPESNTLAFLIDEGGERWYRTGDLVAEEGGEYHYRGRRDRMVKRRGYRIELGEIEAALVQHPCIREVAVIATAGGDTGAQIRAFLSTRDAAPLSVIELKEFSARHLPQYMIPDTFTHVEALPRTSTDKVDYQSLSPRS